MLKTNAKSFAVGAGALMWGLLLPATLSSVPANAYDIGGGRTTFERSPHLTRVAISNVASGPATYHFTIMVPKDAGEPMQAVTITQQPNLEQIGFKLAKSSAFRGDSFAGGPSLSLANIGGSRTSDSNEVTVVFDQPVRPGNTVTISLKGSRPMYGGVYQFGVTAFPVGQNSPGLYLGSSSVTIPQ